MINLILLALAPIIVIAVYIYIRDKYEREPLLMLLLALFVGAVIVIPIIWLENYLSQYIGHFNGLMKPAYNAFVTAAFSEESFKYIVFIIFFWRSKNFNERFDGIVYAVFISLGFAAVENVLYVLNYGTTTGIVRAFTAVPGHAIFGIIMGYYFGLARFNENKKGLLFLAWFLPMFFHGVYDFILMAQFEYFYIVFIVFMVFMFRRGFKRMKKLSDSSVFRKT